MTENAGIFADLGLEQDFDSFPAGQYFGYCTDAKVVSYKDAAKGKALVLTYKVNSEDEHDGKTVDEWKSANAFDDASKKAWLKRRLLSLGVPENRLSQVNPADLIGTAVFFTIKKNGDYTNVSDVKLAEGADGMPAQGVPSAATPDVSNLL